MNDSVFPLSLRDIKRTFVQGDRRLEVLKGITLDLKPGRYAFYCFVSDREGGKPHALKGMVEEFKVE